MYLASNLLLFALALGLGLKLVGHYRQRARPHTLWYAVGLLLTALASLPVMVLDVTGTLPMPLWWAYWVSASATVGFLGTGTAFLVSERFGKDVLMVVGAVTIALFLSVVLTHAKVPMEIGPETLTKSPTATVKLFFLIQNIAGAILIIGGAAWSFIRTRLSYNLLIIVGTLLFSAGGSTSGWMLYAMKAAGMVALYMGVSQSLTAHRPKPATSQ